MCCGMSDKTAIIFIACWTIIQGIGYGIISLLALLIHSCEITSLENNRLTYFMYIIYFRDERCGPTNWSILFEQPTNLDIVPILNDVTDVAHRTNIFAYTYLLISIMWIATSCMIIVAASAACLGRCTYYFLFVPWIFVTICTLILDLVATGFFAYDLSNSFSLLPLLNLLGVENADEIAQYFMNNSYYHINSYLFIPALIMLCAAMRAIILWSLNIVSLIIVWRSAKRITSDAPHIIYSNNKIVRQPDFGYGGSQQSPNNNHELNNNSNNDNNNNNNNQMFVTPQFNSMIQETNRYNDPAQEQQKHHKSVQETNRYNDPAQPQYQYDNPQYQQDNYNINQNRQNNYYPAVIERRYLEPLKGGGGGGGGGSSTHSDDDQINNNKILKNIDAQQKDAYTKNLPPTNQEYIAIYDNRSNGNDSIDDDRHQDQRPRSRPLQSAVIKQVTDQVKRDEQLKRIEQRNSSTPEGIRNQLPWSYFQSPDSGPPKKNYNNLKDDEVLPPVPVPDYTLHFPKKERASSNFIAPSPSPGARSSKSHSPISRISNNDEKWSGPEYRY